jgi:hypothetical protein
MEDQFQPSDSSPLLDVDYDYGIVKDPFPLNWFMRNWYLGPDFYYAVKIGIVQYVRTSDAKLFPFYSLA